MRVCMPRKPNPLTFHVNDAEREVILEGLNHLVETFNLKSRSELLRMIATGDLLVSLPKHPPRHVQQPVAPGDPDLLAAMRRNRPQP